MIAKSNELEALIKNHNYKYFLFYGQNDGLIKETLESLFKKKGVSIYSYFENDILANRKVITEKVSNQSFFDNKKCIIVNNSTSKIIEIIEDVVKINDDETTIVTVASTLEKKSRLRNYFEKNKDTICVPFFEDNHQSLLLICQNFFYKNKINISKQNINLIIEKTRGNRITLKNELEKIKNFSLKKKEIIFNDLIKIINSAENYKITELIDQCLAKNTHKTLNILNENRSSLEDNILIIKTFLYKLKRLKNLKKAIEIKKT
jgi:DNA polymerase-3 subunit delta